MKRTLTMKVFLAATIMIINLFLAGCSSNKLLNNDSLITSKNIAINHISEEKVLEYMNYKIVYLDSENEIIVIDLLTDNKYEFGSVDNISSLSILYVDESYLYATYYKDYTTIQTIKWNFIANEKNVYEIPVTNGSELIQSTFFYGKFYHALSGESYILELDENNKINFIYIDEGSFSGIYMPFIIANDNLYLKLNNDLFYIFRKEDNEFIKVEPIKANNNFIYSIDKLNSNFNLFKGDAITKYKHPKEETFNNIDEDLFYILDKKENKLALGRKNGLHDLLYIYNNEYEYNLIEDKGSIYSGKFINDSEFIYGGGNELFLYNIKNKSNEALYNFDSPILDIDILTDTGNKFEMVIITESGVYKCKIE